MSHCLNFKMSSSRRALYVHETKVAQSQVLMLTIPTAHLEASSSGQRVLLFAVQRLKLLTLSNAQKMNRICFLNSQPAGQKGKYVCRFPFAYCEHSELKSETSEMPKVIMFFQLKATSCFVHLPVFFCGGCQECLEMKGVHLQGPQEYINRTVLKNTYSVSTWFVTIRTSEQGLHFNILFSHSLEVLFY